MFRLWEVPEVGCVESDGYGVRKNTTYLSRWSVFVWENEVSGVRMQSWVRVVNGFWAWMHA